ncbi:hypothetical protein JG687_00002528 [Phytophthora cactorum]|uniref:Uncharacterized protein n=1 Tax=Phytophthora cactorum TaxID=29920 RepID=A0A8T1UUT2_9STRA|nr:hypothetical protein JG687_00002528 [Phytophthora cactorum]
MVDDSIAAEEIARQIAALKPRVEGSRGIMGYLDKPQYDNRADVNKTFLASTIRGVNSHNRRQEEDKCWTLRQMERKLDDSRDRRADRRSHSRSTVSVENAPDFSSEESDDDDVKPKTVKSLPPPDRIEKKHKKHKKHKKRDRKNDKKSKRRS